MLETCLFCGKALEEKVEITDCRTKRCFDCHLCIDYHSNDTSKMKFYRLELEVNGESYALLAFDDLKMGELRILPKNIPISASRTLWQGEGIPFTKDLQKKIRSLVKIQAFF